MTNVDDAVKAAFDKLVKDLEAGAVRDVEIAITDWAEGWIQEHQIATHAILIVTPTQGDQVPGQITVDTTNETVTIEFVDDKGDTNAAAPSNASGAAVVTFTSDNTAVVTVATDASNPLVGDITPVAEGSANIGATLLYPDGTAVLEADGVTPFPVPATVAVTVSAGAAVGDALVLSV